MTLLSVETPVRCPYFNCSGDTCLASFSAMPVPGRKIMATCASEDYDACAIFLSKVLRSSRPGGFGRQTRELGFK